MVRRRHDWLFWVTGATSAAAFLCVSITAELNRHLLRHAANDASLRQSEGEAQRLEHLTAHEFETVTHLRMVADAHRKSAQQCCANAEQLPPGFVHDLWLERAASFEENATRLTEKANILEQQAIAHQYEVSVLHRGALPGTSASVQ